MIANRFGHQSGQDDSSGKNSSIFENGCVSSLNSNVSNKLENTKPQSTQMILQNPDMFGIMVSFPTETKLAAPAASLFSRKLSLGIPKCVKETCVMNRYLLSYSIGIRVQLFCLPIDCLTLHSAPAIDLCKH